MNFLRKAELYFHTLRHLKPLQIWARLYIFLPRQKPDFRPAPALRLISGSWRNPAMKLDSMLSTNRFCFLNLEHDIGGSSDWDLPNMPKLWLYNLHYFDDLNAAGAASRIAAHRELILQWVVCNPPGKGTGWEPYPLSLRIVNWIKWAIAGNVLDDAMRHSLAVQVRYLSRRLEKHLMGNHLFANAKALVFAGCYFCGDEAAKWLRCGMGILSKEIPEQILADGGHFERSTMYHALALEDVLDLINVIQCFFSELPSEFQQELPNLFQRARSMHSWLLAMCHPDGEISLFNDAAFDIAPSVTHLDSYAHRVLMNVTTPSTEPLIYLKHSGYVRLSYGPAVALLDVAPVGPDYQPGHAHADTLSFELSIGVWRLLVNSGTSCYDSGPERLRQRGTAAHNTVTINGKDSSEVWSGFRVARRAYPVGLHIKHYADVSATKVDCSHSGYSWLAGKPVHHRTWLMDSQGLTVIDRVKGAHKNAEARFHFHPSVSVEVGSNEVEGTATLPGDILVTWRLDGGRARLEASTWHPRFGQNDRNVCLIVKLLDGKSTIRFNWGAV